MNYFLGIDIGTTSVKAIAFDDKGVLIHKESIGYEMLHPQPDCSELSVTDMLNAIVLSLNKTTEALLPANASFVSFSSMMHSLIAVDKNGEPITNCIIWADNRAAAIAEELRHTGEGEKFYHATGVPIHAMSPFCKLLWMKEQDVKTFQSAYKFIGIKEYIFFKLFGQYVVDTAVASATGLLNIISLQWDKEALQKIAITEDKLATVVSVKTVMLYQQKKSSCSLSHITDETPFVVGGSDGSLANLGAGSVTNNSISVTIGTSAAIRILSNKPVTEENMSVFCYHAIDDQYIIGGASNNGAVVLQWLKDSLLQTTESYEALYAVAATAAVGSNDLFFVPYILGERAPVWNSEARGIYFGLSINHTKAHLIRSAMEGVIYNLYCIGKQLKKRTRVDEIYAAGGFAQSSLWLQILADVFNCKVFVSGTQESSALGAVMVGMKALHLPSAIHPTIVATYMPNEVNHTIYEAGFQKFERIYQLVKEEFHTAIPSNAILI